MCPHNSKSEVVWPDLDSSYVDEFGRIDRIVYEIARQVWPAVVPAIRRTLRDLHAGQRVMIKAAALVSRKLDDNPEKLENVHGYLYRTFIRLLNEEFATEGKHAEFNRAVLARNELEAQQSDAAIFDKILISQLLSRAGAKTRILFHLRLLGHTFEDIARQQNTQSNLLRSEWSKELRRLAEMIESETREAERQALNSRKRR